MADSWLRGIMWEFARGSPPEASSSWTGAKHETISRIENGHRKPQQGTLQKIAGGLGVEVEDLLTDEPTTRAHRQWRSWLIEDAIRSVDSGELTISEALDALQDAGILQKRRRTSTSSSGRGLTS